jgi:hypothetical protein
VFKICLKSNDFGIFSIVLLSFFSSLSFFFFFFFLLPSDPEKPYYQHSISSEVRWSLAKEREQLKKEGLILMVVPFPTK